MAPSARCSTTTGTETPFTQLIDKEVDMFRIPLPNAMNARPLRQPGAFRHIHSQPTQEVTTHHPINRDTA